jgi:hypothetical protein
MPVPLEYLSAATDSSFRVYARPVIISAMWSPSSTSCFTVLPSNACQEAEPSRHPLVGFCPAKNRQTEKSQPCPVTTSSDRSNKILRQHPHCAGNHPSLPR